jgi:imidazolonepropionase-like amidohydrolase
LAGRAASTFAAGLRALAFGALAASAPAALPARAAVEGPAPAAGAPVLLENARILPVSGPAIAKGQVLLRGGVIVAVGESVEIPADAVRVDLAGRTVCPGFVDAASRAGLDAGDRAGAAAHADTVAADGADLRDPAFVVAREAGVTSLLLSPGAPAGTMGGRTSLVKPRPSGGDAAVVAERLGPLKAGLAAGPRASSLQRAAAAANLRAAWRGARDAEDARRKHARDLADFLEAAAAYAAAGDAPEESLLPAAVPDRLRRLDPEPRERARRDLRAKLGLKDPAKPPVAPRRPQEPRPDPARDVLLATLRGEIAVRFEAVSPEEVRAVAALAAEFRLKASVEGAADGAGAAADLAKARIPVAWWRGAGEPRAPGDPAEAAAPAAFAAGGATVAVSTGRALGPLAVRHLSLLAAEASGEGLSRDAALRAVTLDAAAAAGMAHRVGSLEPGKDADLVVLPGEPLDAATRVVSVWIDGVRVYDAPPEAKR